MALSPDPELRGFFKGTTNCLSALLVAERHEEIHELLAMDRLSFWSYRQFGARALAAMGKKAEAIRYAEEGRSVYDRSYTEISAFCEEVLLSSGLVDEAYRRYGLSANRAGTHLAWFRAIAKKYPHKAPAEILADLVAKSPGNEGKWFAAAKSVKLFDEAIVLANRSPCSPQTLTRAARDFAEKNPTFAVEAGVAALRWLVEGHGYEVSGYDVLDAYSHTMKAAENAGCVDATAGRIRELLAKEKRTGGDQFVTRVLRGRLGGG